MGLFESDIRSPLKATIRDGLRWSAKEQFSYAQGSNVNRLFREVCSNLFSFLFARHLLAGVF
jgi:hypothetical protein